LASTGGDGESPKPIAALSSIHATTFKEIQSLVGILALLVSFGEKVLKATSFYCNSAAAEQYGLFAKSTRIGNRRVMDPRGFFGQEGDRSMFSAITNSQNCVFWPKNGPVPSP
jgi:hypothetical protein